MISIEKLHLEHALQIAGALEKVLLRSFGPEGGQVLLTRATGQAMLSRSGTRILTALSLEHPVARMIVECVWKHCTVTGDGSKTFILLLASVLQMIDSAARKEPKVSAFNSSREAAEAATARRLAEKLLTFALTELDSFIAAYVAPYGFCISLDEFTPQTQSPHCTNCLFFQKFLSSFFHTRLSHVHIDFISDLTCELISRWKFKNTSTSDSLKFLDDNFSELLTLVSGFPINCSRLIEGQVIHRDFSTPYQISQNPVKAVVVTEYLQSELLSQEDVLKLGSRDDGTEVGSIVHFSSWFERSLESIIAKLQSLGVSVLLSTVKQSAAILALATQAEICVVECVSIEELSLFSKISGSTPVLDCWKIQAENIATLSFCQPIQLGAHRYVHVSFCDSEEKAVVDPCSLVICAPGEGQTDQHACAIRDAIRMVLSTWEPVPLTENATLTRPLQNSTSCGRSATPSLHECTVKPGCVIPAGGTFEFLLHLALFRHVQSFSASDGTKISVYQLLGKALLNVPLQIYSHRPKLFLETQTRVLNFMANHSQAFNVVGKEEEDNTELTQTENPLEDFKLSLNSFRKNDMQSNSCLFDLGLESVSGKHKLLQAVLQCVASLLRVDTVLHIHTPINAQSNKLTNSSLEGAEDETEG